MSRPASKVILITGASSGIGEATARHLVGLGHRVVLGARRTERLHALAEELLGMGAQVAYRTTDVTRIDHMRLLVDFAEATFGPVDILVNNARLMAHSPLNALKLGEWNRMVDVNVHGVLHGITAVLPGMEARGSGHVINVVSTGDDAVSPVSAVYNATKYAVRAISDGLRRESKNIRVTLVSPGRVESEMEKSMSDDTARDAMKALRRVAVRPATVAHTIAYAIDQPADVDVSELIVRPVAYSYSKT
jgi:NADP-dependent 3-hydroxy acid dehydrogenase YdfG